jgi:hypothetical protein
MRQPPQMDTHRSIWQRDCAAHCWTWNVIPSVPRCTQAARGANSMTSSRETPKRQRTRCLRSPDDRHATMPHRLHATCRHARAALIRCVRNAEMRPPLEERAVACMHCPTSAPKLMPSQQPLVVCLSVCNVVQLWQFNTAELQCQHSQGPWAPWADLTLPHLVYRST